MRYRSRRDPLLPQARKHRQVFLSSNEHCALSFSLPHIIPHSTVVHTPPHPVPRNSRRSLPSTARAPLATAYAAHCVRVIPASAPYRFAAHLLPLRSLRSPRETKTPSPPARRFPPRPRWGSRTRRWRCRGTRWTCSRSPPRAQASCGSTPRVSSARRIDDGIHRQRRYIALNDLDHWLHPPAVGARVTNGVGGLFPPAEDAEVAERGVTWGS